MLRLLLAFLTTTEPPCLVPCDCIGTISVSQSLTGSDGVFAGTVLSVRDTIRVIALEAAADTVRLPDRAFTFLVTKKWKGPVGDTLVVLTGRGGGDCGYPFGIGGSYLVYAGWSELNRPSGVLGTGICSRTRSLIGADAEVAELDRLARRRP